MYTNAIEAGNKILANTNKIAMYGKPRSKMSRLTKIANIGDTIIYVEPGLDWVAGDRLGLAPTTMNCRNQDYVIVNSYSNITG